MPLSYKWYRFLSSAITSNIYNSIVLRRSRIYTKAHLTANQSIYVWESIVKCHHQTIISSYTGPGSSIPSIFDWSKYNRKQTGQAFHHALHTVERGQAMCMYSVFPFRFTHFIKLLWPLCDWRYEICIWFGWRLPQVYSRQAFQTCHIGKPFLENIFDQSARWQWARNVLCSLTLT